MLKQNLGIQIDKNLTWKEQVSYVAIRLNKVNPMFSKSR